MFGPNVKAGLHGPYMHHREDRFRELLEALNKQFQETFCLPDYDFLFITGSGTTVNEIVIHSLCGRWLVLCSDAKFGNILSLLNDKYHPNTSRSNCLAYVQYETSISRLNIFEKEEQDEVLFADCVSSFPYYSVGGADIFTTVSSKQIGAYPTIGIIGISRTFPLDGLFGFVDQSPEPSTLDLMSYVQFSQKYETPHTPAIPLYQNLLDVVSGFDLECFRKTLDNRITRFGRLMGRHKIGDGPVLTLPFDLPGIDPIAKKWKLYRSPVGYQVFLWSGTTWQYDELYKDLKNRSRRGTK